MKKLLVLILALGFAGTFAQSGLDTYVYQGLSGGPVSMDPVRAYDTASGHVIENIYENPLHL